MPEGPQGQRRPADVVGCAVHVAKIATGEIEDTKPKQPAKVKSGIDRSDSVESKIKQSPPGKETPAWK